MRNLDLREETVVAVGCQEVINGVVGAATRRKIGATNRCTSAAVTTVAHFGPLVVVYWFVEKGERMNVQKRRKEIQYVS